MTIKNMKAGFELLEVLGQATKSISQAMESDYEKTGDMYIAVATLLQEIDALDRKHAEVI